MSRPPRHTPDGAPAAQAGVLATLDDVAERANHYAGRSKSQATISAYAAGLRDFLQFCERRGDEPLAAIAEMVAASALGNPTDERKRASQSDPSRPGASHRE